MKSSLLFSACIALSVTQAVARNSFAIVIDAESYTQARTEVDAYAAAIEKYNDLKVYTIVDRWQKPDSIRCNLERLHNQKSMPLVGAVLIGEIPVAMIRDAQHMTSAFKMRQETDRRESSVPSDRFYDDFHLKFSYLGQDDSISLYHYYSLTAESAQRLQSDIYVGRIRPTETGDGRTRFDKLRRYLAKATAAKAQPRKMENMFFFSGQGYISESKVARMDEKLAWKEHFPALLSRENHMSYIDHTDLFPIKERYMNELMRTDLDLAVVHHHGMPDTQFFSTAPEINTVKEAKEFIRRATRSHIVGAREHGRDYAKTQADIQQRFDLPDSWFADVFDPALAVQDSLDDAITDLHLEDFSAYGYHPNVPVVVIDACYCGSFHQPDCIANQYIFQDGGTIACIANSVNVLQDKWSDRLMGVLSLGGCVGDVVSYASYLESHVIGDPTYRFAPAEGTAYDIASMRIAKKAANWRKLLKRNHPEVQSLAIQELHYLRAISSRELRNIYETSPYGIVRLMALTALSDYADDNFVQALSLASFDSYELLQRLAIRYVRESGHLSLVEPLVRLCISNNTSERVNFDAMDALSVYPTAALTAEFARQFDQPSVCYIHKDNVRKQILHAIEHSSERVTETLDRLDTMTVEASWVTAIRMIRNNMPHHYADRIIAHIDHPSATPLVQKTILEALGWHPASHMAPRIAEAALRISRDERYNAEVRNEALKTYNRLHVQ